MSLRWTGWHLSVTLPVGEDGKRKIFHRSKAIAISITRPQLYAFWYTSILCNWWISDEGDASTWLVLHNRHSEGLSSSPWPSQTSALTFDVWILYVVPAGYRRGAEGGEEGGQEQEGKERERERTRERWRGEDKVLSSGHERRETMRKRQGREIENTRIDKGFHDERESQRYPTDQ